MVPFQRIANEIGRTALSTNLGITPADMKPFMKHG